jgi:hypothetical protein
MQEGQKARELAVKVERMKEGLKNLSMQERSMSTQEVLRKGILTSDPLREPQQCEATTLGEDKNKNGKRIPEIVRETQITGRRKGSSIKRKLSWKNYKKLQKQMEDFTDWNLAGGRFVGFEPRWNNRSRRMGLHLAKLYDRWRHPDH